MKKESVHQDALIWIDQIKYIINSVNSVYIYLILHKINRQMSVSCLPRIHTCACAIKSKQTATSHLGVGI